MHMHTHTHAHARARARASICVCVIVNIVRTINLMLFVCKNVIHYRRLLAYKWYV